MSNPTIVTFYGAQWCGDCRRSRALLDKHGVSFNYVDLEVVEEAAAEVERINGGSKSIPTIVFSDGSVLVEPSDAELSAKLGL